MVSDKRIPRMADDPIPASTTIATPKENVDHPAHYGGKDDPYEVVKVMEAWLTHDEFVGAMKFNVHKYLARARKKNGAEDYAKAAWYARYLEGYLARRPRSGDKD